jgi:diaminohydroxyphosphoribosylaminopyrimidine deaminase/5-amino-6-(5-phosphoribosylamino)uracil reductase
VYSAQDHDLMRRALALAARALNHATPNPRVGCVIARDGRILGDSFPRLDPASHLDFSFIPMQTNRLQS